LAVACGVLNHDPSDSRAYRRKLRIAGHQDGIGKSDGTRGLVDTGGARVGCDRVDFGLGACDGVVESSFHAVGTADGVDVSLFRPHSGEAVDEDLERRPARPALDRDENRRSRGPCGVVEPAGVVVPDGRALYAS
jgi:hypothetical protein